ncbi:MAG: RNA-binding cell elongation regulator Jag/EloR [Candidatus Dormibacteria bacterium]
MEMDEITQQVESGSVQTASVDDGSIEESADTVDEAVAKACGKLGISEKDAEVLVLSQGVTALPGETVSGSLARVRVWKMDALTQRARTILAALLEKMGAEATITARRGHLGSHPAGDAPPVILDVSGDDLGLLIGWRGETLQSIQSLIHLMIATEDDSARKVYIDVERYRLRREEYVRSLAHRIAQRVRETGERYVLDPMQPYERRVVHVALQEEEGVRTESTGVEPRRRVAVIPTNPENATRRPGTAYGNRNQWGHGRRNSSHYDR